MRLSGLSLAAILLFSSAVWAQHSSGGGGGGSSAGGASAGGSHGGGGGSSSSGGSSGGHSSGGSGGGHNSGGTVSHGSSFRGSSARGTSSIGRSGVPEAAANLRYPLHGLNLAPEFRPAAPQKRSFFSILRHPFHRPERKPPVEANIVLPTCVRGHCRPCPAGTRNCSAPVIPVQSRRGCWSRGIWNGCQGQLLDACSGLRFALDQQLHRMQAAQSTMQNGCSGGATQECSETTAAWNSQASLYRALQSRYRSCLAGTANVYPFGGHMIVGYGGGLLFEPLSLDVSH
jgi:hypothetical protein